MGATITQGATTITPQLVLSYESTRRSGNKVHQLLTGALAVTLGGAGLRTGTLELFFLTEQAAAAAELAHTVSAVFTISDPGRPTMAMTYVLADGGALVRRLDPETRDRWIVTVDFQEVTV